MKTTLAIAFTASVAHAECTPSDPLDGFIHEGEVYHMGLELRPEVVAENPYYYVFFSADRNWIIIRAEKQEGPGEFLFCLEQDGGQGSSFRARGFMGGPLPSPLAFD